MILQRLIKGSIDWDLDYDGFKVFRTKISTLCGGFLSKLPTIKAQQPTQETFV